MSSNQPCPSPQSKEDSRKVTFVVGGMEAGFSSATAVASSPPSPAHSPRPPASPADDNVFTESPPFTTTAFETSHLVNVRTETKQTTVSQFASMTTQASAREYSQTTKSCLEVPGDSVVDKTAVRSVQTERNVVCKETTTRASRTSRGMDSTSAEPSSSNNQAPMQQFERQEQEFRDLFLSKPDIDLTGIQTLAPVRKESRSVPVSPTRPYSGLDNLDNLVRILEQLTVLREENVRLRRKCSYLEDTKSLLQARAEMVEAKMHHEGSHEHSSHYRFFQHQHARAKSLISKQQAKIMHYLSAPGTSYPSTYHSPSHSPKPALEKLSSDGSVINVFKSVTPSPEPRTAEQLPLIHTRSQSVGSIEMVDLQQLNTTELETKISSRRSTGKSMVFRRGDFKASKKLQEKWERVKKVFGGKPEVGSSAAVEGTATVVRSNSGGMKKKPPSLTHMCSMDAGNTTITLDTLKPIDRTLSKSNPQLCELHPHTPSSTQSEPPCNIPSPGTEDEQAMDEQLEELYPDGSWTQESTPSTTKKYTFDLPSKEEAEAAERLQKIISSVSSDSSEESDEADVFQTTPSNEATITPTITDGRSSSEKQFLTVSPVLPRRRSSPSLTAQSSQEETVPSNTLNRSCSDTGHLASSDGQQGSNSTSMPSSPMCSDGADRRGQSEFRPDTTKKARSAWDIVKNIIQTRRDSFKRKSRSPGCADSDRDASPLHLTSEEEKSQQEYQDESKGEVPILSTKSQHDRSSPAIIRKTIKSIVPSGRGLSPDQRKNLSPSQPSRERSVSPVSRTDSKSKRESLAQALKTGSPADLVAIMGVSEEHQKKMQSWEEKKKRGLPKASSFTSEPEPPPPPPEPQTKEDVTYTKAFIKKMEAWEQMKGLGVQPLKPRGSLKEKSRTSPKEASPRELSPALGLTDEPQLSESFSKRVQEWERVKTRRIRDGKTASSSPERSTRPPTDRSRSREREKVDRELKSKIEKKEEKIKRETQKLEKMKLKLEACLEDGSYLEDATRTSDFLRKFHQWEEMKGLRGTVGTETSRYVSSAAHYRSQSTKEADPRLRSLSRDRMLSDGAIKALQGQGAHCRSKQPPGGTPQEATLPAEPDVDGKHQSDKLILRLRSDLEYKDDEIGLLQDDISQLTERINDMDKDHSVEIANYRRELWASSKLGRYTVESDLLAAQLRELELQVNYFQAYCQRLAREKRYLQMKVQDQNQERYKSEEKFLEELRHIQNALDLKSGGQHESNAEGTRRLYNYLLKAQEQVKQLYSCIEQRNQLLEHMQRHILVQEVSNKLLAADIHRRDMDIMFLQESKRHGIIRRWKTFHGREFSSRGDGQAQLAPPVYTRESPQLHSSSLEIQQGMKNLTPCSEQTHGLSQEWMQDARNQLTARKEPTSSKDVLVQTLLTLNSAEFRNPGTSQTFTSSKPPSSTNDKSMQTSHHDVHTDETLLSDSSPASKHRREKSSYKERQYSLQADEVERLVHQYRTQDGSNASSQLELPSMDNTPEKSPVASRATKALGSSPYSDWLRRDYRQHRRLRSSGGNEDEEIDGSKELTDRERYFLDSEGSGPDISFSTHAPKSPGAGRLTFFPASSDTENKSPHLGQAPATRPKHPVGLRTSQQQQIIKVKLHGMSSEPSKTSDSATGGELLDPCDNESLIRERTKSDSSALESPAITTQVGIGATKKYRSLDRGGESKPTGVKRLVHRFEQSTKDAPSRQHHPPSATPLTISPVRRLKTAQELLQDSKSRTRSRTRDNSGMMASGERPTSDKENEKKEYPSRVHVLLQRFLGDSLPGNEKASGKSSASAASQMTGSSLSKPPLSDRTNGVERNGGDNSPVPIRGATGSEIEVQVEIEGRSRVESCGSKSDIQETSSASQTPQLSPLNKRSGKISTTSSAEEIEGSPWQLQESKPSKGARQKVPPLTSSQAKESGKGAISALCMQAMSINIDQGSAEKSDECAPPGSPGGDSKGKSKGKFLDGNWLQKPRRFFKTSNC